MIIDERSKLLKFTLEHYYRNLVKSRCVGCFREHTNIEYAFLLGELSFKLSHKVEIVSSCRLLFH
jgi:hypothetical protein